MTAPWFKLPRGWGEDDLFGKEPYCRRAAFVSLVEMAAWRAHVQLFNGSAVAVARGQFATSERDLAARWRWSRKKATDFLEYLEIAGKLSRQKSQRWTVITISDYALFSPSLAALGASDGATEEATEKPVRTPQQKNKEGKEGKEEVGAPSHQNDRAPRGPYAFAGKVIRLNRADLAQWRAAFAAIPDLEAELIGRDAWLRDQPADVRQRWFPSTAAQLAKINREILLAERADAPMDGPAIV